MSVEIIMPKLGLTMAEGSIVEWQFKEGDEVQKGEVLFTLETEKVTYEVEAPEAGILIRIVVPEGEEVPVGTVVGYIGALGEEIAVPAGSIPLPGEALPGEAAAPAVAPVGDNPQAIVRINQPGGSGARSKASPLAKKVARTYGMDLVAITGTGPGGRIIREDVEKAHDLMQRAPAPVSNGTEQVPEERLVAFTGMRRAIAKSMLASKVETAQTYMSITIDAQNIVECRKALLPQIQEEFDVRVTITDIAMKIFGAAVAKHPVMNTRWADKGILYLSQVHMGMAMALNEGLIVPVIRDINNKTFARIALDRVELIRKGKDNSFLPDDISGSTITLSAMGMFGIEQFTSNINLPETAILAVGAIIDKPVALGGEVVIRPMMTITLSYDHRVIDGAAAGKFMQTLKAFMEDPIKIFA